MINIHNKLVSGLPLLEIVKDHLSEDALPTVFFYHGWEGYKERVLEEAYILAEKDFRVLLPDIYNHGERKMTKTQDPMSFWELVGQSVKEFPRIVDFYVEENKTIADRIGVAGLSMGGIISSAILTQFDWVKSVSILMGSPSPIELTRWMLKNNQIDSNLDERVLNEDFVERKLKELVPISLNLQAEKIAGRSVYFWHGLDDDVVPATLTEDFVEKNKKTDYGKNISLELTAGVGHTVPGNIIKQMAHHFVDNL